MTTTAPIAIEAPDIDFLSGAFWGGDPHPALTWIRENDPLYFDGTVWGVSTHGLLRDISRRPHPFSNAQGIRPDSGPLPMMIDLDDPEHFRRRKLVSEGFMPKRVRETEGAIREACDDIIDDVAERGECDFVKDIASWLPMIMIGDALGVPHEMRGTLLEWSDDMLRGLVGSQGEAMEKAGAAYAGFREYIVPALEERRLNPRDDLLSLLVHAEIDGDRLDDEALIHESLLILIGGDETTRHVISGGLYQLLANPSEKQKVLDDPTAIPRAVEEMLRWVSPIRNMTRTVLEDTELAGKPLKEGDKLLLLYPSANRDATVFEDPFRFDIDRFPNDHVAFGFGTHFCLGNKLARLELRCMFEHLFRRLPDIALAEDREPANRAANFVSGYESMPVLFTPAARVGA